MNMKSYLKPCTACTKVENEGYLLAGSDPDNPSVGHDGFTPGGGNQGDGNKGGGGCGGCGNTKTPSKFAPKSVTNGFSFSSGDE
nr:hypothetical protein [uncultured Prevotella sp.]